MTTALFVSLALGASVPGAEALQQDINAYYDQRLDELFKYFHENPELSFREFETSKRLAKELRNLGVEVTEGVGGTGLVGLVKNGPGPTVMVRADMDGLPVKEKSGLPYASTATQKDINDVVQPVMHACGHDVHMTALVGTAKMLMERKDQWSGTLILIGQPAEERIGGARRMLEDGLYTQFPKPEYALAFHVASDIQAGKIELVSGLAYSSSDSVDIIVKGVAAHGASPHQGIDPVLVGSHIVVALQSLVSRSIAPLQPGVVTVGAFHAGSKHNIISDEARLQLTVRSNDLKVRDELLDGIDRIASGVGRAFGLSDDMLPQVVRSEESVPPTRNDPELTARIRSAFVEHFGESQMHTEPPEGMGAEDFSLFVSEETGVKGVYFNVGGTPASGLDTAASHHSPLFKIAPRPSVTTGVEAMVVAVMELMPKAES
ncbi:MAG: amidohydrolase [Myxococcota bacterium]